MIQTFFPTTLLKKRAPSKLSSAEFLKRLEKTCKGVSEIDEAGRKWSQENYPGGFTSYSSMNKLWEFSSDFAQLKTWIDREVKTFSKSLDLDLLEGSLEMTSFWANLMGPMSQHSFHLHPLSTISGTFYVRTPKNAGGFRIEDPRISSFMASPPRHQKASTANQRYITLKPREGELLLFESWLKHEVPANRDPQPRISVSFNYDWIRK